MYLILLAVKLQVTLSKLITSSRTGMNIVGPRKAPNVGMPASKAENGGRHK
jgi:hypothetical protein